MHHFTHLKQLSFAGREGWQRKAEKEIIYLFIYLLSLPEDMFTNFRGRGRGEGERERDRQTDIIVREKHQ